MYFSLFEAITESAVLLDKAGRILHWNQSATDTFGYQKKDVLGKSINLIYDRNFPFPRLIQEAHTEKKTWLQNTIYVTKNGQKGHCQTRLSPITFPSDQKVSALLMHLSHSASDILDMFNAATVPLKDFILSTTLLLETVNQLEKISHKFSDSELRFRLLAENATDVISRHVPNGNFLYVSPACKTTTGYTPDELMQRNLFQIIVLEDQKKIKKIFARKRMSSQQRPIIYRIKHKEGELRWFESNIRIIADKHQHVKEIQLASRDVTDRVNDKRARLRGQQLAKVFRLSTMEEMASGMAHEISQPLAAVVNYTRGCIRHLESDAHDKAQILSVMQKAAIQAARAGEIIQRLKNFFGKGQLIKTSCKINNIIRETVTLTQTELVNAKIKMEFRFDRNIPFIFIDKIQIQQVIANLLYNATEAMQEANIRNKRIIIETQLSEHDTIDTTFRDTGRGFPKDIINHVFTPFFTTKAHGRGMGLAICRSIIEAHGGQFVINPNTHHDSWIRFSLPISS